MYYPWMQRYSCVGSQFVPISYCTGKEADIIGLFSNYGDLNIFMVIVARGSRKGRLVGG